MKQQDGSIHDLYQKGKENLNKKKIDWSYPPDSAIGASVRANRLFLDSLFFETRLLDPVDPSISCSILGTRLSTPLFCSPLSQNEFLSEEDLLLIARGVQQADALMMLGIGSEKLLQRTVNQGAKIVKIVKPYQDTELIFKKVSQARECGCVAVGMDIDHFYGRLRGDRVDRNMAFGPKSSTEIRQIIAESKLPFIVKGVLSPIDAEKAFQLGTSAIIVSNHGPSAIDFSVPSTIALPRISKNFAGKLEIFVDSGFKTGNDIVKALALGAEAVGFASSMILAYMADGTQGVEVLINLLSAELRRTMAATGCADLKGITGSIIEDCSSLQNKFS
ncbi:MAG: alpha-hydroxy-acid oxidizing protein [Desulfohalobiaceae bacterium]|nr:alpha-hydroxy-acid oxidizing protein [Desulfohalobiaceae bacterium]